MPNRHTTTTRPSSQAGATAAIYDRGPPWSADGGPLASVTDVIRASRDDVHVRCNLPPDRQRNGQPHDVFGNKLPSAKDPVGHIPLDDFNFIPELFQ